MKHFLGLTDLTSAELHHLLTLAKKLKDEWKQGGNKPILQGKTLAMLFQKSSLRTRVSFEIGMVQLGGYALTLSPDEVKVGSRESPADVARVLSRYVDGFMARVYDHNMMLELAQYATVPVINGLSDYNHPAQILADLFTISEHKGSLDGLKVAYVGDGNNVARSLLFGSMLTGINFAIASPSGYMLPEEDFDKAAGLQTGSASIQIYSTPDAAVAEADIIYTDVWISMGQENERADRLQVFPPYQLNQQLLQKAKPDCLVMHCLPAHRGEEITDAVADSEQSIIFAQSENRLHAQKAILAHLLGPKTN